MIEIKHRETGAILHTVNAETLSGANLWGAYLSLADLSGADLSGAKLSGADLSRADLSLANLSGANMSRVDLSGANMSGAKGYRPENCSALAALHRAEVAFGC